MNKNAPSIGRMLTMVGFAASCFAILLYLWLAFGGSVPLQPKGYRITANFPEATTLANEADVRISGVQGRQGQDARSSTEDKHATAGRRSRSSRATRRCRKDTRAILRQKTLLGETYVELTPGHAATPA